MGPVQCHGSLSAERENAHRLSYNHSFHPNIRKYFPATFSPDDKMRFVLLFAALLSSDVTGRFLSNEHFLFGHKFLETSSLNRSRTRQPQNSFHGFRPRAICPEQCENGDRCRTGGPCTTDGMYCLPDKFACQDGGCCSKWRRLCYRQRCASM